jgi:pimeloyl-ACP methyl ester carboxylesterase
VPLLDRNLYPADQYPDGQWDYYRFYLTHFNQSVSDMETDIPATLASLYRPGNPAFAAAAGKISPSALITANGGRYGSAHRAPPTTPDAALWPPVDFDALVSAFRVTGFRPANAWYLNDTENAQYARSAAHDGRLLQPVLFVNGDFDPICDINRGRLAEPMRNACQALSVITMAAGHWVPLERKTELTRVIRSWLETNSKQG